MLATDARFELRMVVSQPDRPAGRGHRLVSPPARETAGEFDIPVIQPETLRDEGVRTELRAIDADLFVVAAYGRIFSQAILDIPRHGCLNLHASILPNYRGAAPVAAAILNGDKATGVTLMIMERGLDTGPVVTSREIEIEPRDTTETLTARLADVGAELARETIPQLIAGGLSPTPQPVGGSIVRQLVKADGAINWLQPAVHIERQVRAMWPWPRATTELGGRPFQLHLASVPQQAPVGMAEPGTVVSVDGTAAITCGNGSMLIVEIGQLSGGRAQAGKDLLRGRVLKEGDRLPSLPGPDEPLIRRVPD
jgi:methionyl-tRNA formyltransferase